MNQPSIEWLRPVAEKMITDLVKRDRVHSRIYTDPGIFELEMARIFGKAWLFIGHESEIPAAGDYKLRKMGRTSVIFVRGRDKTVRVLMNRCRHRGAQVCESEQGNTRQFTCWFHGWSFENTGKLLGVTQPGGYTRPMTDGDMDLTAAPRMESYRGFVFASLSETGLPLKEELGLAASRLDILIDASPTGEVFLDAGQHKTSYRGNWKMVGMDGYHPNYLHGSVVASWKRNEDSGLGSTHRDDPYSDTALSRTRDLGYGHCQLDLLQQRLKQYERHCEFVNGFKGGADYIAAMHKAYGAERAKLLIAAGGDPHVGLFPNLQIINNHVRIITPVTIDHTELLMLPVRIGGMSDEMNAGRLRQHESFYGPCGSGSPDDAEMFERVQMGLHAEVDPWIDLSRGLDRETVDADGSIVGLITDEVTQRAQAKRWVQLMGAQG